MTQEELIRKMEKLKDYEATGFSPTEITDKKIFFGKILDSVKIEDLTLWIPVSERLPDIGKSVLISCKNGDVAEGERNNCSGDWTQYRWSSTRKDVVAWQPLPESYKGE